MGAIKIDDYYYILSDEISIIAIIKKFSNCYVYKYINNIVRVI